MAKSKAADSKTKEVATKPNVITKKTTKKTLIISSASKSIKGDLDDMFKSKKSKTIAKAAKKPAAEAPVIK